ncbi:winged helix-turn-helix transcriptional regulator [Bacillus pumilus]|uniref:winged helix-turn-helix transcriptional regulator n=1 Tax=Bacillus pumilus TaxID=1408 RepID=UPI000D03AB9C|nr:helix-turn-helix domain-containing protein [Bacillus pumilus]MCY7502805.1 helix-turn-helix transcriptional regulator [Bacillus pumilus]MCY7529121.1 helix-turn-helix transcriptional regulator [Bacillus pumilus]MED4440237.1 helix-turn-helix domain-containing protein [Bacillus pumilus]MED4489083.1 helix-turn-helix domain-containing protein [Bacillus pumilus]PRS17081.1 transcriptional regulator [Bacillus pumilus]
MTMNGYHGKIKNIQDTPFGYTLSLIGGKWKMVILYLLAENHPIRYNELHRMIGNITFKTLSSQLKELEMSELIVRKEYPQIPPKVEYYLTAKGASLIPILEEMCEWGIENQPPSEIETQ